jgi:hypothetical protein
MAVKGFKDIIQNRGYKIDSKDRKVFEEGNLQSFFGFGESDAIEFVLYDINDNQLPQRNNELARYVPLTSDNIKDYFLIAEGTLLEKHKFPSEYFVDIERLIREAGYSNGVFKTQITLLNKRVGSNDINDKMWISEISPSRTEIRLYPLKKGLDTMSNNLGERFDLFKKNGEFRDDTINLAFNFIEKINPSIISSFMKTKYSEKWTNKMIGEFKIKEFESLTTTIYEKFSQACFYEFTNRISDINDLNYGKAKKTLTEIGLSKETIRDRCKNLLIQTITKYLPQQNINTQTTFDNKTDESIDEVQLVLQRLESNTIIDTSKPALKEITKIKPMQRDRDIHFAEKIKKQIPPDEKIGVPIVITPIEEPAKPTPEAPIIKETPVEQPPVYGGGGGGGYRGAVGGENSSRGGGGYNNPWDMMDGAGGNRQMEFE